MKHKTIFIAALSVALVIGILWFTNRAVTPKAATWEDVLQEAKLGDYRIIKTEEISGPVSKKSAGPYAGGYSARMGISNRTPQRGGQSFPWSPRPGPAWRKQKEMETFLGTDKNRFIVFY